MKGTERKLITIITEAVLEPGLLRDLEQLGARGYTVTDARGKGHRGVREASWDTTANIRVEVVCNPEVATAITEHLWQHYYPYYAMILYMSDVAVLRPEKF